MVDLHGFGAQLLTGARTTLLVAALSLCLGTLVGLCGAAAKLSCVPALRFTSEVYTTIVRGIPELLVILVLYFGGTVALTALLGGYVEVDALTAGVFALTIVFGAYATEVFRGAIIAVPPSQIEAGQALGLPRFVIWRLIIVPQMWRFALPGLGNLWLVLLKDTSLVSVIGLDDLMRKAIVASGSTREPLTFYASSATLYLAFTAASLIVLGMAERRATRGVRLAS